MMPRLLVAAVSLLISVAHAQILAPNENLIAEGIPPIPSELAEKVNAFGNFPSASMAAWHPAQNAMLIRARDKSTTQLFMLAKPGTRPELLTDFPDAVAGAIFQPKSGEYIIFQKAREGDEVFQLFRMNLASREVVPISDAKERAGVPVWNRAGNRIAYSSTTIDRNRKSAKTDDEGEDRNAVMTLWFTDPLAPKSARKLASFKGGTFSAFRFSPDDKTLLMQESVSSSESHLWLLDIATGSKRRLTLPTVLPQAQDPVSRVYYTLARFSRDGRHVFAVSDRDSEFRRLVRIDVETGKEEALAPQFKYDIIEFSVSEKAKRIALLTSEEGSSVLRFLDLDTFKELPRPALLAGIISGLRWNIVDGPDGDAGKVLAFNLVSARSPGAAFAFNVDTVRLTRWTTSNTRGANPQEFVEPRLIKWKSFDGLPLSGFLYSPDAKKFSGKRPVIINIHGGPASQARAGFLGRVNYLINVLGIAIVYPNVRGSTGFGKTFLAMDNGRNREDSVKDIGALLDWIKEQPDLDTTRVLVQGGSYGGYMSLAVSTHYADRIVGAIDVVGISNWVTFLTDTESYRRDARRAEYGDERDPEMRKFLEAISPLNNAQKIRKPLFVVQGKNDPRVPYTEAEQIVAQLKKQGTPVWFLMALDEGHGFAKKANADFLFYAQIMFLRETLLK